jgi:Mrp family chromosome partitioning ATPase
MITNQMITEALRSVKDPELGRDLVDLGMVRDIQITVPKVTVTIALTTPSCPLKGRISEDVQRELLKLDGVTEVVVETTTMTEAERTKVLSTVNAVSKEKEGPTASDVNHIGRVIAIMSGKGGVGKSLVTGLFAVALAREGKRVGILDGDITGPSIPKMFGLRGWPEQGPLGLYPVESKTGIKVMSLNLLLSSEDDAVIWRGPVISGTIKQFWEEVVWGDLDYLLVDLPPGTADAPLTVLQTLPVSGVVIVTTPQDLTSMVVRKAVRMAQKMNVSVLGIVENMSYFLCPDNGKRYDIFGKSRVDEVVRMARAPLLGQLPIDPKITDLCDQGNVEDYHSEAYRDLANELIKIEQLAQPTAARQ